MEITVQSGDLARVAATEIGPDVMQVRFAQTTEEDRGFFTGIEIAIIVGTCVVRAFWKGFTKGARKSLEEHGEKWGQRAVDTLFHNIEATLKLDDGPERELPQRARQAQAELDLVVNELTGLLTAQQFQDALKQARQDQLAEIQGTLGDLGFDEESAKSLAERLVEQLTVETTE